MSVKLVIPSIVVCALLIAGCSHSGGLLGGGGGAARSSSGPPSAAVIQAQMSKVQSDPSIPAGQKAMILGQMQRAISMQKLQRPATPQKPAQAHP